MTSEKDFQTGVRLSDLLASRDRRWHRQMELLGEHPDETLLCLTVIMPGSVKRNRLSLTVARAATEALQATFGDSLTWMEEHDRETGFEAYAFTSLPLLDAKRTACRIEEEHPLLKGRKIRGVADPAIFQSQTGESIAETGERCGIWFEKGDHARIPGWMQMHYRLRFDENGRAMMYVFKTCRDFIRTMPLLRYDAQIPEDLDTTGEDHAADEARYFCMARPIAPRFRKDAAGRPALSPLDLCDKDLAPMLPPPGAIVVKKADGDPASEEKNSAANA